MLFPEKFIQLKGAVWVFRFIFLLHHVCRGIFQELYSDAQIAQLILIGMTLFTRESSWKT
jgi:hypothetical protein